MGRQWILVAAMTLALAGCSASDGTPVQVTPSVATAEVERTDLSTARIMPGTLGYGMSRTIRASAGTVTWLPKTGATMRRGQPLYRNDDKPVLVMYGTTPLFRPIEGAGLTGRDVRVVVDNLRALGYQVGDQPGRIRPGDAVLTTAVVEAVKRWQLDTGCPVTGVVTPADVVVLPGAVRVGQVTAQLGEPAADGVLIVTGRRKAITVPVRADDLGSIKAGAAVQVELPSGGTVPGTVSGVDRDVTAPEGEVPAVDVTVTIKNTKAVRALDSAPVQVSFTGEVRAGVLAVPVAALLALREGGHAVQIAGGPLVAVETGMFAMGLVEISGDGLTEGVRVVTAS
ncbi:HlyD family efflux transporter periplasmic adaptor subunit [Actinoplanes derwentensis]|uniref:Multidrug efflux pump subunit AcrA (Membrane-fusion protein) n=1 Tax=Actinoplanes derwentensis TaxID=113562 RepID=A0A1H1RIV2_9ACTN|nr:HlyD family efflux transporter periplasmic adaptor subunit [Actinoplanes derwentensis]GID84438.1 peptidoglycan-binding protein [Actinoplanes derwentensis]SDS35717.1 Multidrug efflux pump subunit AcrA (membrane-fusion protein) [Actinoplanes derwentensis]